MFDLQQLCLIAQPNDAVDDAALERARRAARPKNTSRGYAADLRAYEVWCADHPGETIGSPRSLCRYLIEVAEKGKASTLRRRLHGINAEYEYRYHSTSPGRTKEVRQTLSGLLNEADRDPQKVRDRKLAALTLAVRKVCSAIDADREAVPDDDVAQLVAARDRAIILASYGAALTSGELVSIHREDLIEVDVGLQVEVNRSEIASRARRALIVRGKCPQTDPVEAVLAWLRLAGITHGPVFRAISPYGSVAPNRLTTRAVTDIVKTRFCRARCNPARFSPHSLRSGFVAQTALAGALNPEIMAAAGIRDARSIAEVTKIARRLRHHPARLLGL